MTNYAEQVIKKALAQSGGNAARARQNIMTLCAQDDKLLQALSRPHLTGIVAHAVNRVIHQKTIRAKSSVSPSPNVRKEDFSDQDFGKEILKAIAANSGAVFGQEAYAAPQKRGKASKSHIDALKKMTGKTD